MVDFLFGVRNDVADPVTVPMGFLGANSGFTCNFSLML